MRIVRCCADNEIFYAVLEGDVCKRLIGTPYEGIDTDGREYELCKVKLLAPCEPTKVLCVGKNYYAHSQEMQEGHPEEPLLFLKPNTTVIGPEDDIIYPSLSKRVDHECELGIVIGKSARNVRPGTAKDYIFGYTCLNDVTARDIQKSDGQWTRGKSFDTFCPIGPWIETDLDPADIAVETRLNGSVKQHSRTSLMSHDVDKLICYMTACMTLLPGDVIATGTPEGIGPMERGDVVEVEVEGIGILRNAVK